MRWQKGQSFSRSSRLLINTRERQKGKEFGLYSKEFVVHIFWLKKTFEMMKKRRMLTTRRFTSQLQCLITLYFNICSCEKIIIFAFHIRWKFVKKKEIK